MDNVIILEHIGKFEPDFEFVERKGKGHPDTLSDSLAERLSLVYSRYTKDHFGAILHHNFDKTGLLGGASHVEFGKGYLTKPIRVLLTGRASTKFGDEIIPLEEMLIDETKRFFQEKFPMIDINNGLEFHYLLSNKSSPGKVDENTKEEGTRKHWFEPRSLSDLGELRFLGSNDTSLGCGYYPFTQLEQLILEIEDTLNSEQYKQDKPWLGSDIKLMGTRYLNEVDLTLCIPQIASHVKNIEEYRRNIESIEKTINEIFIKQSKGGVLEKISIHINTRDNYDTCELYLTATGSSIESGDEGLVGRGNRVNGLISPMKPMSMEGAAGKNPVYHIGKIYYIAAQKIAKKIYELTGSYVEVYLVSQSGRMLIDPWKTVVYIDKENITNSELRSLIFEELRKIPDITQDFLAGETIC
ncbi:MAG: methionine adenosyltransferase [Candidatus Gracilibacteria bacterium]|nr:methionine adenosyltransferase [Candidatus Gracilibacteria bacterium]